MRTPVRVPEDALTFDGTPPGLLRHVRPRDTGQMDLATLTLLLRRLHRGVRAEHADDGCPSRRLVGSDCHPVGFPRDRVDLRRPLRLLAATASFPGPTSAGPCSTRPPPPRRGRASSTSMPARAGATASPTPPRAPVTTASCSRTRRSSGATPAQPFDADPHRIGCPFRPLRAIRPRGGAGTPSIALPPTTLDRGPSNVSNLPPPRRRHCCGVGRSARRERRGPSLRGRHLQRQRPDALDDLQPVQDHEHLPRVGLCRRHPRRLGGRGEQRNGRRPGLRRHAH